MHSKAEKENLDLLSIRKVQREALKTKCFGCKHRAKNAIFSLAQNSLFMDNSSDKVSLLQHRLEDMRQ